MQHASSGEHAASEFQLFARRVKPSRLLEMWRQERLGPRYIGGVATLVLAYYAAAHVGYAFEFSGPVAALVWLPVGVGIAYLYLRGMRFWPGVVLGDLLVNNYSALPLGSALGQSFGNLLEVVVATLLLRRLCPRGEPLASLRGVTGVLAAIVTGTLLSATIGSVSLWLGNAISSASLPYIWRTWWLGDLSGALIILPLAMSWSRPPPRPWQPARVLEAVVAVAAVAGLSALALDGTHVTRSLAFPTLIWAALRFGPRGATLAITLISASAVWGATHDMGPFAVGSINSRLLGTQLFIVSVCLSALAIAALASERELLAERVRASRSRLVKASDEARRRLERDLHDGAQQRLVALAARLTLSAERAHEAHEEAAKSLEAAQAEVLVAIEELRDFSRGVHPSVLRHFGLAQAIQGIAARSTIPIELLELPRGRLDDTSEATAYYIVLEAITNAQRYSRASAVTVGAALRHGRLVLAVADDGIGGAVERPGSGLQGLRDRVEATGGSFRIESEPNRGTRITADFPISISVTEATSEPDGLSPRPHRRPMRGLRGKKR